MDRVKDALTDAVTYADELVRDERLRSDVRSAYGHGAAATERVREDLGEANFTSRLATDRKLRKSLRALLDDLDSAGERVRRKRSHRVRNAMLIVVGTGAAVAVIPNARRWISGQTSASRNGEVETDVATV